MKIRYFLAVTFLAIAVFGFAGFVAAQTDNSALIAQLEAQIAGLMDQLKVLKAQQPAPTAWCHTFTKYLFLGITDSEVDDLRAALFNNGEHLPIAGGVNGSYFDNDVRTSLIKFQGKYGISQTGAIGPITRARLNSLYQCATPPVSCVPNWTCSWGSCINGYQSQTPIDSNNCGISPSNINIACTALARACNSIQPSFNILSPNGGEILPVAQSYAIKWNASGLSSSDTVSISLYDTSMYCPAGIAGCWTTKTIATTQNTGTYYWDTNTVYGDGGPNNPIQLSATTLPAGAVYKIKINVSGPDGSASGMSNMPFTIASANQHSIAVTSPIAGTTYHAGDTINISWSTVGIVGNLGLGVVDVNGTVIAGPGGMGTLGMISASVPNTGNYSWQIPSNFTLGNNYRVNVTAYNNGSPVQGYSGYFNIAAPPSSSQPSITYLSTNIGGPGTVITIYGSNFTSNSDPCFDQTICVSGVQFISSSQIRFVLNSTNNLTLGRHSLFVLNRNFNDLSGQWSNNSAWFTVTQ